MLIIIAYRTSCIRSDNDNVKAEYNNISQVHILPFKANLTGTCKYSSGPILRTGGIFFRMRMVDEDLGE